MRRLSKLLTKFTEVAMSVRKWDSIIHDPTDAAKMVRVQAIEKNRYRAEELAEERILDVLIPPAKITGDRPNSSRSRPLLVRHSAKNCVKASLMTKKLRSILPQHRWALKLCSSGMEEMTSQLQSMFQNLGGQKQRRKAENQRRMKLLIEEEAATRTRKS